MHAAKAGGYSLGAKLVRGAYHPHEMEAHSTSLSISPDSLPPVWPTKPETDKCYNECAEVLLDAVAEDLKSSLRQRGRPTGFLSSLWRTHAGSDTDSAASIPSVGVLFGTHNWKSCRLVLDGLGARELAHQDGITAEGEPVLAISNEVTERLALAQLYGASMTLFQHWRSYPSINTAIISIRHARQSDRLSCPEGQDFLAMRH